MVPQRRPVRESPRTGQLTGPGRIPHSCTVDDAAIIGLWGYAEGDPTIVAILVAAVAVFGIAYVIRALLARRGPRRGKGAAPRR